MVGLASYDWTGKDPMLGEPPVNLRHIAGFRVVMYRIAGEQAEKRPVVFHGAARITTLVLLEFSNEKWNELGGGDSLRRC